MKHFLLFMATVFFGLFLAVFFRNSRDPSRESKPVLRVFAATSFISQWGPGPWLRNQFEQSCNCRVEFFDGADPTILMQRLKSESHQGADVVLGLDQYDLEMAKASFDWKNISTSGLPFDEHVKPVLGQSEFVPYDWGILSFVLRRSETPQFPKNLDDFLRPDWKGKISMEDPRTSSPGLQFFLWLVQLRGEDGAFSYLKKFNPQVKAYSTSWSMAYGLFTKDQAQTVFSYVTSPVYHKVEEKNPDVVAVEMDEAYPTQFEFVGIPANCKQCDLADKFVALILSPEGQKVIMEKNYMFPVLQGVKDGTIFAEIPPYKTLPWTAPPSLNNRERLLKKWSALRRAE